MAAAAVQEPGAGAGRAAGGTLERERAVAPGGGRRSHALASGREAKIMEKRAASRETKGREETGKKGGGEIGRGRRGGINCECRREGPFASSPFPPQEEHWTHDAPRESSPAGTLNIKFVKAHTSEDGVHATLRASGAPPASRKVGCKPPSKFMGLVAAWEEGLFGLPPEILQGTANVAF